MQYMEINKKEGEKNKITETEWLKLKDAQKKYAYVTQKKFCRDLWGGRKMQKRKKFLINDMKLLCCMELMFGLT